MPGGHNVIPVSLITGFLGSGKTTLIGRILRDPAFSRTAVIVNEFGEIGIDHTLIASSDESLLALTTGCLCCAVQTDLARTLLALMRRRDAGTADYDRVLIETSGLADPAPILHALMTDPQLAPTHRIGAVITVVDATQGEETLQRHQEALRQVALADQLLVSKTDRTSPSDALLSRLQALNPGASLTTTATVEAEALFTAGSVASLTQRMATLPRAPTRMTLGRGRHTDGIETFLLTRERPLPALALTLLLQSLAEHCGGRLLRVKGLVAIEEMLDRPAVIHGIRHVFEPPVFLDRWPNDEARTQIVFIATDVPRYFPARLLDAIEEDVRDEMLRQF